MEKEAEAAEKEKRQNIAYKKQMYEGIASMKQTVTSWKLIGSYAASSAASTEYGLGSGSFARPLSLAQIGKKTGRRGRRRSMVVSRTGP